MDNFMEVYKSWLQSRVWAAERELTAIQRINLAQADNAKRRLWNALPDTRRREIVEQLVADDILPQEVLAAMDIFDARVVGI